MNELSKQKYVPAWSRAVIYSGVAEKDKAFEWLEKAYQEHALSSGPVAIRVDPIFDPLRSYPRFQDLLRRMNLTVEPRRRMMRKPFILIAKWNSAMRLVASAVTAVAALIVCLPVVARADDVADVKAAEMAFNAAQNAGDTNGMFKYLLPDRTVYGSSGGRLVQGWTEESRKRRQADFDAGRKIDLKIEELSVRIYGDTAVSTFYRIGMMKELDGITRQVHLRISGVWVRQRGEWKLAHRHESAF